MTKTWELQSDFSIVRLKKILKERLKRPSSNLEELIVNAYDADATLVQIVFDLDKRTLKIIDNGSGMDRKTLVKYLTYGQTNKTGRYKSLKFGRSPLGEKGMGIGGKLAISNICRICKIATRKDGQEHIFNMDKVQLDKANFKTKVYTKNCNASLHGTTIYMKEIVYKNIDINNLMKGFSFKRVKVQNFRIRISTVKNGKKKQKDMSGSISAPLKELGYNDVLESSKKTQLTVYYTKGTILTTKQRIWTMVNGKMYHVCLHRQNND